jgi:hypothetical protein
LADVAGYWSGPLPTIDELKDTFLGHGANWSQYFQYSQLCHVIVPRKVHWEPANPGQFEQADIGQDVDSVAEVLRASDIPHRLTPMALEIKSY